MLRLLLVATVLLVAGCTMVRPAPGSPSQAEVERLLNTVHVVDKRPDVRGYQRSCKPGDGCVFGPAWTDDTAAPMSHDGCDTRNNVLATQLKNVTFKPGTGDCVVLSGMLDDPYTGSTIEFSKAHAGKVQIDHIIPLAAAWDLGAARWPLELRARFANDVDLNLLAVNGDSNQQKSDSTPSEWLPQPAYRCFYTAKYLAVAVSYGLPITKADFAALQRISRTC